MRILSIATLAALTLGLTVSAAAYAQSDESVQGGKQFGYRDPQTGIFHPLERAVPDATATPTTGTISVTFTITLKTAVPTGGSVLCSTSVIASSTSLTTGTGSTYEETAYSVAKVTGSTATCTVTTPYSWILPAASSTTTTLLAGDYTAQIVPAPSTTVSLASIEGRQSSSSFVNSKTIPLTGTTSKYTVNVTL